MLGVKKASQMALVLSAFTLIWLTVFTCESTSGELTELADKMRNPRLADSIRIRAGKELLGLLEDTKEVKIRIETHLQLGDLEKGEIRKRQYQKGLVLAREFNLKEPQARLLNKLGIVKRSRGDHEGAVKLHNEAIDLTEDDENRANYLNSKGITLMAVRDHAAAKEVFNEAVFLNMKYQNLPQLASVYNNLGLIAQREAIYGESMFYYDQAEAARIELADTVEWARVLKNKSIVYNQLGEFAQAAENLFQAVRLFEGAGDKNKLELASAYNSLGVAYVNLKEYKSARQYYAKAIGLRREINNLSGLAGSYNNLANLQRYTGRLDSAKWYLLKSIALKKELRRDISLIPSYKNLAEVYIELEQFGLAQSYLDSANALAATAGNDRLLASNYLTTALLHLGVSDAQEAKSALAAAIELLNTIGSKDLILEVYDLYRKAYFLEGDATMAEKYVFKYDSLDDHLSEVQRMKVVKLKPQRDNAELVWLSTKKEADDAIYAASLRRLLTLVFIISLLVLLMVTGMAFYRKKSRREALLKNSVLAKNDQLKQRSDQLEEEQANTEKEIQSGLAFFDDRIVIRADAKDKKKAVILPYKEIILVKSNGDYLYWYTRECQQLITRTTLNSITERIKVHGLIRCHRSWIVNSSYVKSLERLDDGSVNLLLHESLEVLTTSKTHKKKLIRQQIGKVPVGGAFLDEIIRLFQE